MAWLRDRVIRRPRMFRKEDDVPPNIVEQTRRRAQIRRKGMRKSGEHLRGERAVLVPATFGRKISIASDSVLPVTTRVTCVYRQVFTVMLYNVVKEIGKGCIAQLGICVVFVPLIGKRRSCRKQVRILDLRPID